MFLKTFLLRRLGEAVKLLFLLNHSPIIKQPLSIFAYRSPQSQLALNGQLIYHQAEVREEKNRSGCY